MEVTHHPIGVVQMKICWRVGVKDSGESADGEVEHHA